MRNKIIVLTLISLVALFLSACSSPALAQVPPQTPTPQPAQPRILSVSGEAQVQLTPDVAYITIGVHTESENVKQAIDNNNTKAQKVVDAIKAAGVAEKDVRTSNFNVYPNQQTGPNGETKGTIYMVDNSVFVTLRDLNNVSAVLDAAVNAGANSINGIQFDLLDKSQALTQGRKTAVDNAKKTAQEMASAAGVTLGDIQSISFSQGGPIVYDAYAKGIGGGAAAAPSSVPIAPGSLTITVDVYLVYAIQ